MDYHNIRVDLERELSDELRRLFQGDLIQRVLRDGKVESTKNRTQEMLEGHGFRISERMAPDLLALCKGVQERLGFDEPIEFFIANDPEINAFAALRDEEDHSHVIAINRGLLERVDDDELRFIVGHEIGHLISRARDLERIISTIFPADTSVPLVFYNKITLWEKLAELTADRYGFIASPSLDCCVAAFFKLACGLDVRRIDFSPRAYLSEMEELLERMTSERRATSETHPVNPVRIKALHLFSESQLFARVAAQEPPAADELLSEGIAALVETLKIVGDSELDSYRKEFVAVGGIIAAEIDGEVSNEELEHIMDGLAAYTVFPKDVLHDMWKAEDLGERLARSGAALVERNPAERYGMLDYLINVTLADRRLQERELTFLYEIGEGLLQIPKIEIAQHIAALVERGFRPALF